MHANSKTTRFPGSIIFCKERPKKLSHSHLYRVLTGERQSQTLVDEYAAWLRKHGLKWPSTAKAKPKAA